MEPFNFQFRGREYTAFIENSKLNDFSFGFCLSTSRLLGENNQVLNKFTFITLSFWVKFCLVVEKKN